jgi:DNA-binding transcriptional ArsR family regulator
VVEYLEKHPAATAREIADAIGKKIPAVSFHLAAIRKAA